MFASVAENVRRMCLRVGGGGSLLVLLLGASGVVVFDTRSWRHRDALCSTTNAPSAGS